MKNPIKNAVVEITKKQVVSCKRCGCPDLAWVTYKSGKKGLVHVNYSRPLWRGEGPAPVGIFALKFNFHKCDEYLALKAEADRRVNSCHPKSDNPREILADAFKHAIIPACVQDGYKQLQEGKGPLFEATEIILKAQSEITNI